MSAVNEVLQAPGEKPKGKRGRPPKSVQPEAPNVPMPIVTQDAPSEVTPVAKRLRPRKDDKKNHKLKISF